MRKTASILALAMIVMLPSISLADDTSTTATTTTPTDCGTAPTRPTPPATADQMTAFQQARQTYFKCLHPNATGQGAGGGQGFGLGAGHWGQNGQGGTGQGTATGQNTAMQDRCTRINQRITDRVTNFQTMQSGDKTLFGNLYARLSNIQTRIQNAGVDTTKLQADLATLKTDIDKTNTDYATFISDLQGVQSSGDVCGQSQGKFMAQLASARTVLMTVRADRLAVRTYITGTIIPDIQALRKQLQAKEGTTTPAVTTTPAATTPMP